jgi:serine/threonine protein kinase
MKYIVTFDRVYKILETLGSGTYATVYRCKFKELLIPNLLTINNSLTSSNSGCLTKYLTNRDSIIYNHDKIKNEEVEDNDGALKKSDLSILSYIEKADSDAKNNEPRVNFNIRDEKKKYLLEDTNVQISRTYSNNSQVVVKFMDFNKMNPNIVDIEKMKDVFINERDILRLLKHDNIIKMLDSNLLKKSDLIRFSVNLRDLCMRYKDYKFIYYKLIKYLDVGCNLSVFFDKDVYHKKSKKFLDIFKSKKADEKYVKMNDGKSTNKSDIIVYNRNNTDYLGSALYIFEHNDGYISMFPWVQKKLGDTYYTDMRYSYDILSYYTTDKIIVKYNVIRDYNCLKSAISNEADNKYMCGKLVKNVLAKSIFNNDVLKNSEIASKVTTYVNLKYKVDKHLDIVDKVMQQIIDAISYSHKKGVLHLDIKLENILIHPKTLDIKIIDWGLALMKSKVKLESPRGSIHYSDPHILINKNIIGTMSTNTDIWSIGIILFILLYCKFPLPFVDNIKKYLRSLTIHKYDLYDNILNNMPLPLRKYKIILSKIFCDVNHRLDLATFRDYISGNDV